jgi:hypothetical protein
MSTWTQVNGIITIRDLMPELGLKTSESEIRKLLGNTCTFGDNDDVWDACNVPCGSEGSIQYFIQKVDYIYVNWIVAIMGALRDYENVDEIKQWFEKILQAKMMFREATLQVMVENEEKVVFSLVRGKSNKVETLMQN